MRELIKKEQIVTIVPQDFKNSNKGRILDVSLDGFRMELKYKPEGLIKNHICDFYSLTDNGYLYFESYNKRICFHRVPAMWNQQHKSNPCQLFDRNNFCTKP